MSAYKIIQTQFRNKDSLLKALAQMGYTGGLIQVAEDYRHNTLRMDGYGGTHRDVSIRLPLKSRKSAYEDVGFTWDEKAKAFSAVVSTHDSGSNFGSQKLAELKQTYASAEVRRLARIEGYEVEERIENGVKILRLIVEE